VKSGSCTICIDPRRTELEQSHFAGASLRNLAEQFGRNKDTIQKHVTQHIPAAAQKAIEAAEARQAAQGDSILDELDALRVVGNRLLAKAEKKRDYRTAVAGLRELLRLAELKARARGELRDREINVTNVQLDADTAARMAEMFLARRAPPRTIALGCTTRRPLQPRMRALMIRVLGQFVRRPALSYTVPTP
jgi:hypothetical protein